MSEGRTTVARRLKDGTIVEVLPNATTRQFPPDDTDWARVDALTEEEITATAETDPDNLPLTEKRAKTRRRLWTTKFIRRALGLTQEPSRCSVSRCVFRQPWAETSPPAACRGLR